jgi:uncharacterized protein CbrC (UPF0167 family)
MDLPAFKYHPDPIATGAIKQSEAICDCCTKSRGYIYTSNLYCAAEVEAICPWCIADGSAAKKFQGLFCDDSPLAEAGLSEEIIDEVSHRTPGFNSWQQEVWLSCCTDACEFHGDASLEDIKGMNIDAFQKAFHGAKVSESDFNEFKRHYQPGENPAIYKWVCRHCRKIIYYADFT